MSDKPYRINIRITGDNVVGVASIAQEVAALLRARGIETELTPTPRMACGSPEVAALAMKECTSVGIEHRFVRNPRGRKRNERRGRELTTGAYATRAQLVQKVHQLYHTTGCNRRQVAEHCGVSTGTVNKILDNETPKEPL